jgi:hypothetical protein
MNGKRKALILGILFTGSAPLFADEPYDLGPLPNVPGLRETLMLADNPQPPTPPPTTPGVGVPGPGGQR